MKQTFTFFLFSFFTFWFQTGYGQWVEIAPSIVPTFYNSALAWDGKAYFAGGIQNISTANAKMEILDLASNNLTFKNLSVGRGGMMSVAHNGKLYFAGGYKWINNGAAYQTYSNVDIYDTATEMFLTTLHLTVPRFEGAAIALGDEIIFAGGYTFDGSTLLPSDVVEIYNTVSGGWKIEYLSQARGDLEAAAIGDSVYFCGGAIDILSGLSSNRVDIYDGTTWTIDSISEARIAPSVVAAGKYLLVAGGASIDVYKYDIVDIFNTETQTWSEAILSEPRCYLAAATIGKKAYFTGGGNCNAATFFLDESSKTVDVFDAETSDWDTTVPLNVNRIAHACTAWGDKIAVGGGWRPEQSGFTGSLEVLNDSTFVAVQQRTSEDDILSVFPNPAFGEITLRLPDNFTIFKDLKMTLSDLTGRTCFQAALRSTEERLDIGQLPSGMYLLEVRNGAGRFVKKVVLL